jgi:hypothetical protein
MAKRDLDAELKLIHLQQKEFERQQQELIQLQRAQLEEQQRQHRLQQEQLQKQQQQQIQLQHEKWQERKRMLKEQEQLTQKQLLQQKDLEQQHQTQQRQQQQQQQQQQYVSGVADAFSNNSSSGSNPSSTNAYRLSFSGPSARGTPTMADRFASTPRSSLDDQERYKAPTFQSSNTTNDQNALIDTSIPTVPAKSARRTGVNGGATTTSTTAPVKTARRTSFTSNILPPGQKPELLPKPTRFRMKDGTGNLATGEEEAFKRKYPSADLDEDLMQFQTPAAPVSSSSGLYNGVKENSPVSLSSGYGRTATSSSTGTNNSQYTSPSQRATEQLQQQQQQQLSPSQRQQQRQQQQQDDDEEEDEPLVRSRRRQHIAPGNTASPSTGSKNELEEVGDANGPIESVRERVQRMNRVGRVA